MLRNPVQVLFAAMLTARHVEISGIILQFPGIPFINIDYQ